MVEQNRKIKQKHKFSYNELNNGDIKTQITITKINEFIDKDAIITTVLIHIMVLLNLLIGTIIIKWLRLVV